MEFPSSFSTTKLLPDTAFSFSESEESSMRLTILPSTRSQPQQLHCFNGSLSCGLASMDGGEGGEGGLEEIQIRIRISGLTRVNDQSQIRK